MDRTVAAVYEKGVLRPLEPLDLQEHQAVRIQVLSEGPSQDGGEAAIRALVRDGLLTPPLGSSDASPMTREEREELADRLGRASGKPLSEFIIEDRGER